MTERSQEVNRSGAGRLGYEFAIRDSKEGNIRRVVGKINRDDNLSPLQKASLRAQADLKYNTTFSPQVGVRRTIRKSEYATPNESSTVNSNTEGAKKSEQNSSQPQKAMPNLMDESMAAKLARADAIAEEIAKQRAGKTRSSHEPIPVFVYGTPKTGTYNQYGEAISEVKVGQYSKGQKVEEDNNSVPVKESAPASKVDNKEESSTPNVIILPAAGAGVPAERGLVAADGRQPIGDDQTVNGEFREVDDGAHVNGVNIPVNGAHTHPDGVNPVTGAQVVNEPVRVAADGGMPEPVVVNAADTNPNGVNPDGVNPDGAPRVDQAESVDPALDERINGPENLEANAVRNPTAAHNANVRRGRLGFLRDLIPQSRNGRLLGCGLPSFILAGALALALFGKGCGPIFGANAAPGNPEGGSAYPYGTLTPKPTETVSFPGGLDPTMTSTPTGTATETSTVTPTSTDTAVVTETATPTATATGTDEGSLPGMNSQAPTRVPGIESQAPTVGPSPVSPTETPTATATTPSETATPTNTPTPRSEHNETPTSTPTVTNTPRPGSTNTPTSTPTNTETPRPGTTPTNTPTSTETPTPTNTPRPSTPTNTPTVTPTEVINTKTPTPTKTPLPTLTFTPTRAATLTPTVAPSATPTIRPTETPPVPNTPSSVATSTPATTPPPTVTRPASVTPYPSETAIPGSTPTPKPSETPPVPNTPGSVATSTPATTPPVPTTGPATVTPYPPETAVVH